MCCSRIRELPGGRGQASSIGSRGGWLDIGQGRATAENKGGGELTRKGGGHGRAPNRGSTRVVHGHGDGTGLRAAMACWLQGDGEGMASTLLQERAPWQGAAGGRPWNQGRERR
jgi:hypothetical protein